MTVVTLGNPAPLMQEKVLILDDEGRPVLDSDDNPTYNQVSVPAAHLDVTTTVYGMSPGNPELGIPAFDDEEWVEHTLSTDNDRVLTMIARVLGSEHRKYAVGVHEINDSWGTHCGNGKGPDWVDSDDPEFAAAIAAFYGCPVGEPTALLVNAGRDALHKQHIDTAAQPASCNYMAVSANVTAPSTASTTLPGEITTAGGGLLRAQGTFAHTTGTNTSTLTKTFTANGSDSLPVTLGKLGVLNASSSGTLCYETLLNATATLTVSGDSTTITWTDTIG